MNRLLKKKKKKKEEEKEQQNCTLLTTQIFLLAQNLICLSLPLYPETRGKKNMLLLLLLLLLLFLLLLTQKTSWLTRPSSSINARTIVVLMFSMSAISAQQRTYLHEGLGCPLILLGYLFYAGHQVSCFSDHRETMAFGPF